MCFSAAWRETMTASKVKCPGCVKEIEELEYTQDIVEQRMVYFDVTTGDLEDVKLGEDGGDTSHLRCPECGKVLARNMQEAEELLEPADVPIIIEGLITLFKRYNMNIMEWYIPEYDKTLIVLIVCDCAVKSEVIEQANRMFNIIYNEWDASSCYLWVYNEEGVRPIHRGEDDCDSNNSRWTTERTSAVHLYYKINEVGVPERWNKRMRKRHAPDSQSSHQ